jgi:phosphomevalonate kinase
MTNLFDRVLARNNAFTEETNKILDQHKDKLTSIINALRKQEKADASDIEVTWKHVNLSENYENTKKDLVLFQGFTAVNAGDVIFDPETNAKLVVTEKTKDFYSNYVRLLVSAKALENDSIEQIAENMKELQRQDKKMTAAEFLSRQSPKTTKH